MDDNRANEAMTNDPVSAHRRYAELTLAAGLELRLTGNMTAHPTSNSVPLTCSRSTTYEWSVPLLLSR